MRSLSKPIGTILVLISIFLFSRPGYAKYGGGSGTAEDPYQIATPEDLITLGETPEDYDTHVVSDQSSNSAVYLLITNETLREAFQPLVDRRTMQGKTGKLVTVEEISNDAEYRGSDVQEAIRNCIRHHYQNHGTQWVCLGGDENIVPVRYCPTKTGDDLVPADLYYSDTDGGNWDCDGDSLYGEVGDVTQIELTPEVHLGRIPVRSVEDTTAYINKVVSYESASAERFANSMILVGGGDGHGIEGRYLEYVQPYWQAVPLYLWSAYAPPPWNENSCVDGLLKHQQLVGHLNEGCHYVLYSGHANFTGWDGKNCINRGEAEALTNGIPSIVISGGCRPAGFDRAEPSMSEAFLRNPHGGAVVFFGYTRGVGEPNQVDKLLLAIFRDGKRVVGEAISHSKAVLAPGYVNHPAHHCNFSLQGDPCIQLLGEESGRHVQILQPRGCETIQQGSDLVIRWNAAGTGFAADEKVKLEYSADSGQTWYMVPGAEALPYNGRVLTWPKCALASGSQYRVRVVSLTDPSISDASERNFVIAELGALSISSAPIKGVEIGGPCGDIITTSYSVTVLEGLTVTLTAPVVPESDKALVFNRWVGEAGQTLTYQLEYSFVFAHETVVVAEYGSERPIRNYYVNDEVADGNLAAGNDENDGLTPETPMRSIQALLDKYAVGGLGYSVNIAPGVYPGDIMLTANNTGLTLKGAGAGVTVIDGGQVHQCIGMDGFAGGTICGLTISNGSAQDGGGMDCSNSSPTIINCVFCSNVASGSGGAVVIGGKSSARFIDCTFTSNTALNAAERGGGAVFVKAGTPVFERCSFQANQANQYGAAILAKGDSRPVVKRCAFADNSTPHRGGAVCAIDTATIEVEYCSFNGNSSGSRGGGIYNSESSVARIVGCLFTGNSSGSSGGAIASFGNAKSSIENCTFSANKADQGGALSVCDVGETTVENCILWGNTAPSGPEAYVSACLSISYSNIKSGRDGIYLGSQATLDWGLGNIDAYPMFGEPGFWDPNGTPADAKDDFWVDGDYHLESEAGRWDPGKQGWIKDEMTSPCIDAGDPEADYSSEVWPHGQCVNMGAYGRTSQASLSLSDLGNRADFNDDGMIDARDLISVCRMWLAEERPVREDLNRDNFVNFVDLAEIGRCWLE